MPSGVYRGVSNSEVQTQVEAEMSPEDRESRSRNHSKSALEAWEKRRKGNTSVSLEDISKIISQALTGLETISGENSHHWRGGPRKYGWAWRDIAFFILRRDNWTCQECGTKEDLCPHHIDYDVENMDDTNLITLCRPCNSKVNSNRNYWQRYFTGKIREIYQVIGSK